MNFVVKPDTTVYSLVGVEELKTQLDRIEAKVDALTNRSEKSEAEKAEVIRRISSHILDPWADDERKADSQ